ncbi:VOC family protein [Lysobacter sp. CA199]|uniref:VOC family protein n=1 Tax=Lysobacter sp. CA199 TaxID=3455608 RepID=UPI003F8D1BB9
MTDIARPLHSAYVLAVPDAEVTATWWETRFGFERWLEPPGWVFLRRGACDLRLGSCPGALSPREIGDHNYFGYVVVDAIDALFEQARARGLGSLAPPHDQPWGMREMFVQTPDGHRLVFAQEIAAPTRDV